MAGERARARVWLAVVLIVIGVGGVWLYRGQLPGITLAWAAPGPAVPCFMAPV